jgi:ABC-2 type transport system permease protein
MSGSVPSGRAIAITYRVLLRQLVTKGRVIALSFIGAIVALLGWAVGQARNDDSFLSEELIEQVRLDDAVATVTNVGFTILVPIVSLVFAAASFGDTREDGTLVYLWLRPMKRWPIVLGAWLASITVSLPLVVIPMSVSAYLHDVGSDLVVGAALGSFVGVLAYSALFVLLGLFVKNGIVWGLAYIIIWEGVVAAFGSAAAKIAMRGYTSSIVSERTGVEIDIGTLAESTAIVVPLIVAVFAIWLASVRLQNLEVA